MEPEEEDGDDEMSEEDSIEYPTSGGDSDGYDLSEDDADDEDGEESSDSEDEEEEHLALTIPAPARYSSVSASEETKPFEEGETIATPPPFGYHVAARISFQLHVFMLFCSELEVERLLTIPTPPLSLVLPTSYPLPPLKPLPIFTPLPTSSFPLPSSLPSTSGSESIPEADIPLQKRARFTTPIGGYEIMDYCHSREVHTSTLVTQMEALQRDKMAPKRTTRSTQVPPVTPAPTVTTTTITEAQLQALIDQGVSAAMAEAEASRVKNGYGSNGSGPRLAQAVRECTYLDFLKCQPLNFKGTEGVIRLTQWFEKMESVFNISNCTAACQAKYAVYTLQGVALTWWNSHVKTVTLEVAQALPWKTLKKMMTDKVEKYIGGVPDTIHDSVKAAKPKTMQEAIEFATELMDKRICDAVENKRKFEGTSGNNQYQPQQNKRQNTGRAYVVGNSDRNMYAGPKPLCSKCDYHHEGPCPPRCNNCKRVGHLTRDCRSQPANANNNNNNQKGNGCYKCGAQGHCKRNCPKLKNNNRGNQGRNDNAQARVYVVRNAGANLDNAVAGTFLLNNLYSYILFDTGADRSFVSTTFSSQIDITPIALDHQYNVEIADGRIIGKQQEE
nr:hypothetical protein [Tanacetum cinerariifolium]